MVEQYPHYLYVQQQEPSSRDPKNGDFVPGRTYWTLHARCREETNGRGEEIQTADQHTYRFSSLIQLPKGTPRIEDGATVLVSDDPDMASVRITGRSAKFDTGQLHCRLWL